MTARYVLTEDLLLFTANGRGRIPCSVCDSRLMMEATRKMTMGLIEAPATIAAAANPPKQIEEYIGRLKNGNEAISIARMVSPGGWQEPGQTPEFDEYTLVLKGAVRIETCAGVVNVTAGQAFFASNGEWVRYTTPAEGGAEYVAVCLPAFSPEAVNRDPLPFPNLEEERAHAT